MDGGAGDDTLAGGAGNDVIDGNDGIDTVSYENDTAGIQVNLGAQAAIDGFGGNDNLLNIENVVGSDFNDVIIGGNGDNNLNGGAGNDILAGGDGNDILNGGGSQAGQLDQLYGSADGNTDVFVIGDTNSAFYLGGGSTFGIADRADIFNFENGVDQIQVNTSGGVLVNSLGSQTDLFVLTQANGNFEIIARLVDFTDTSIVNNGTFTSA